MACNRAIIAIGLWALLFAAPAFGKEGYLPPCGIPCYRACLKNFKLGFLCKFCFACIGFQPNRPGGAKLIARLGPKFSPAPASSPSASKEISHNSQDWKGRRLIMY